MRVITAQYFTFESEVWRQNHLPLTYFYIPAGSNTQKIKPEIFWSCWLIKYLVSQVSLLFYWLLRTKHFQKWLYNNTYIYRWVCDTGNRTKVGVRVICNLYNNYTLCLYIYTYININWNNERQNFQRKLLFLVKKHNRFCIVCVQKYRLCEWHSHIYIMYKGKYIGIYLTKQILYSYVQL